MPVVESSITVPVDPATAFAVSQTTGATRLRSKVSRASKVRDCSDAHAPIWLRRGRLAK